MQKQTICLAPQLLHWLSAPGILWILAGSWVVFLCVFFSSGDICTEAHDGVWGEVIGWAVICCELACVWGRAVRYLVLQWSGLALSCPLLLPAFRPKRFLLYPYRKAVHQEVHRCDSQHSKGPNREYFVYSDKKKIKKNLKSTIFWSAAVFEHARWDMIMARMGQCP